MNNIESARVKTLSIQEETKPRDPTPTDATSLDLFVSLLPTDYIFRQHERSPAGYPKLARWMASGDNLSILREFRYLQTRTLLHLQDELRSLEENLFRLDDSDRRHRPDLLKSTEVDSELCGKRGALLETIRVKWMAYADFILAANKVRQLERPSKVELGNVEAFFRDFVPLVAEENFLVDELDLRNVRPTGDTAAWLDQVILALLMRYSSPPLRWVFGARKHGKYETEPGSRDIVYSTGRVHILKVTILMILILALLSGPLYPLYAWTQSTIDAKTMAAIMGLQGGCTMLFGVVLAACTTAKRHEIFTASATYMAILIVFMGQSGTNKEG